MKVLISPFSQKLRNGKENPKNYPYWRELIDLMIKEGMEITQIGVKGELELAKDCRFNLSLSQLRELIKEYDTWISVDNFFHHFCWYYGKKGIALWGISDPGIFGHKENINLLKSRDYLRKDQFDLWENAEYSRDAFMKPEEVIKYLI